MLGAEPEKQDSKPNAFIQRLDKQVALEQELIQKGAALLRQNESMYGSDLFLLGAMKRTLAQSSGFRELIAAKNFPCAAAIVRLQIDTAMRINGLSLVNDIDAFCGELMEGKRFNQIKDRDGKKLADFYLRQRLGEKHPWINSVYETTSDLIHLSPKHLFTSIIRTDDETRTVHFLIGDRDPPRPDETYFEAMDGFFEATKLAGMLILACLTAHRMQADGAPQ